MASEKASDLASATRPSDLACATRMAPSTRRSAVLAVAAVFALGIVVPAIFGPVETSRAARGAGSTGLAPIHAHTARAQTARTGAQARLGISLRTRVESLQSAPTT